MTVGYDVKKKRFYVTLTYFSFTHMHATQKPLIFGIGISILLHGVLIAILSVSYVPFRGKDVELEFSIKAGTAQTPAPPLALRKSVRGDEIKAADVTEDIVPVETDTPVPSEADVPEAPFHPLTHDEWVLNSAEMKMMRWLMENPATAAGPSPELPHEGQQTGLPHDSRPIMPMGGPQYVKESKGFSLFPAPKPKKPELDFIPSDAALDALCVVWQQDSVSDQDIYTQLDTSLRVTAEDLNGILTHLTDKGLLTRKLISPQHKFKFFFLPEDRFGLELSAKNRRNRVFQYSPNIASRDVLDFLNASVYRMEQAPKDPPTSDPAQEIKRKILRMLSRLKP